MILFALALAGGAAVGAIRGGRPGRFAGLSLRAPALVWVAMGMQLALGSRLTAGLTSSARFGVVVASLALAGGWLVLNAGLHLGWERASFGLLALGWSLNLLVMLPNGGMPVSVAAHRAVGSPGGDSISDGSLWKHVAAGDDTVLGPLGDVIPLAALNAVVSVGDVVMLVGLATLVATAMGPRPLEGDDGTPFHATALPAAG